MQGENECPDKEFWKKLLGLKVPGKFVNLLFRACCRCFPTSVALAAKHVNVSTLCSWCHACVEDDKHVLFECNFALELWDSVGLRHLITTQVHDLVI